MTNLADRVTRFPSDLVDDAAAEGARENRSARQQLEHWARIGREVSTQRGIPRRRVEAALAGRTPLSDLSPEEGVVFNAETAAALEESLTSGNHLAERTAQGRTTVFLDDHGRVVKHLPDGTQIVL